MTLRLGIIGMSPGNGHPYSWAAIFNGYDRERMEACPFPAIPRYLATRSFPADSLEDLARVTHVWAQTPEVARDIAAASQVGSVCSRLEDMVGHVDAVLLARDDAPLHAAHAAPFLEAGLPIYIDKPVALSLGELDALFEMQRYQSQIFSCSALRYASELTWDTTVTGPVRYIHASVPKYWDTYAVHVLEPIVAMLPDAGWSKATTLARRFGLGTIADTQIDGLQLRVIATGHLPSSIRIDVVGDIGASTGTFVDSFTAFRSALRTFVESVSTGTVSIPRSQTRDIVCLIEAGRRL